jgi:hypothetical protein
MPIYIVSLRSDIGRKFLASTDQSNHQFVQEEIGL